MNIKKTAPVLFLVLLFTPHISAQKAVFPEIKAQAYSHHVELTFPNAGGFTYEIYRNSKGSKKTIKCGETQDKYYIDFIKNPETNHPYTYTVVPKGAAVQSDAAVKKSLSVTLPIASDEALLDMVQRYTTRYFYDNAHPTTGLARERTNNQNGDIVTTGGTGFGIMALIAGVDRGYITREQAVTTIHKIVTFLENTERFHGAWAHWYDGTTGKSFSFSQYDDGGDLVETALLVQGLLVARQYLLEGTADERELSARIGTLWEGVEWNWYTQNNSDSLYWHWSPKYGWKMNHRIKGFDETLIAYILAAASPTYPIRAEVYHKCYTQSDYFKNGKSYYGIPLSLGMEYGGPLFFSQYSFLGLNPIGLCDKYANYEERNRNHTLIHRSYAIDNPKKHKGLNKSLWGFTSSDDPLVGYTSHHPNTNDENGTVSPTAAISSIVYTPQESLEVMRNLYYNLGDKTWGKYGFYDAINLSMVEGQQVVHSYLAIDQGPIAVMIENYRSALIWHLFAQNKEIATGLEKLGFYYKK